jgi:hypothetical protein
MCIACELGYWSMVDALEAERSALRKTSASDDSAFACEADAEDANSEQATRAQRSADEPTP